MLAVKICLGALKTVFDHLVVVLIMIAPTSNSFLMLIPPFRSGTKDISGNPVVAVASMDITLGFLWKMVLEFLPDCDKKLKCMMFDDRGYVIVHPTMFHETSEHGSRQVCILRTCTFLPFPAPDF